MADTITKALVTAAGLGTRMRPLTLAVPKELLPLGSKPVLHRVLDELAAGGIEEAAIAVSPRNPAMRHYLESVPLPLRITFVYQLDSLGLGDAVRCGRQFVGEEPFLLALGDCLIDSPEPGGPIRRLRCAAQRCGHTCVLCEDVPRHLVELYGVLVPSEEPGELFRFADVVEKPPAERAPSSLVIAARYVLTNDIFHALEQTPLDHLGELPLAQAIGRMARSGVPCSAVRLLPEETRLDIGSFESYSQAFQLLAERDQRIK